MSPFLARRSRRGGAAVVLYTDGGHHFRFLEPALRRALYPRPAVFRRAARRPDVVVASVFGDEHRRHRGRARRLVVVGEPTFHAERLADVDLVLCATRTVSAPNVAYWPFYATSFGQRAFHRPHDLVQRPEAARRAAREKTKFCAFLYRRDAAERDRLFDLLSRHRPVDALGVAKSPTGGDGGAERAVDREEWSFFDLAVERYRPYKFVICGENLRAPGYVTEKLVNAMLAPAVPIYLGAPDVDRHFDPASFLDAGVLDGETLLERVRALDDDPQAYADQLARPWFPGNVLPEWFSTEALAARLRPALA